MDSKFSDDLVIGAIDVGSPKNMGWAIIQGSEKQTGQDLDEFINRFATASTSTPAALGFEAPLFIPCRSELSTITKGRIGEGNRAWSAHAGAAVSTIGLAVMTYTLRNLKQRMDKRAATLDWRKWPKGNAMLVFEAFVSGSNHAGPDEHHIDALSAAEGFQQALPDLDAANAVTGDEVLSLAGTCLIRTGWSEASVDLLKQSCLVIRPPAKGEAQERATTAPSRGSDYAWEANPENLAYEAFIGPLYKDDRGKGDIERLYQIAEINGFTGRREKYAHMNKGQQVMALRGLLRPLWRSGDIRTS